MQDVTPIVPELRGVLDVNGCSGARKVAGVVLAKNARGAHAILLRQYSDEHGHALFELPGGDLRDGEMPVPGLRRLLAAGQPHDLDAVMLHWEWMQSYTVVPPKGAVGVGFVLTARIHSSEMVLLASRVDDGLRWFPFSEVRHWAPYCPDGVLPLLIAATTAERGQPRAEQPIHESYLWPGRRAGTEVDFTAAGSSHDGRQTTGTVA